jgi:predicted permease
MSGIPLEGTRILYTGPDFFNTMQIPMRLGRGIGPRDRPDSPAAAVVNEVFAKTYLSGQNPIGRHITIAIRDRRDFEIVGVCGNARYGGMTQDIPAVIFIPYNQVPFGAVQQMTYELRTAGDPLRYLTAVKQIVHQMDQHVPVTDAKTQAAEIDQMMNQEIIFAKLCSGFAAIALVIACVGLYGSISYQVARRTGEIGIRMALGADRSAVVWIVLRNVLGLTASGLAAGLAIALAGSKLIESFLYRLQPNDPWAFGLAVLILLSAALLAGCVPAWNAARIDPTVALRAE